MAGSLAASLTSLKGGGWRVKGDHAVPAQPVPYGTQPGPQAPSQPGSQGLPGATCPLAKSAASPANHGGRLLSAQWERGGRGGGRRVRAGPGARPDPGCLGVAAGVAPILRCRRAEII